MKDTGQNGSECRQDHVVAELFWLGKQRRLRGFELGRSRRVDGFLAALSRRLRDRASSREQAQYDQDKLRCKPFGCSVDMLDRLSSLLELVGLGKAGESRVLTGLAAKPVKPRLGWPISITPEDGRSSRSVGIGPVITQDPDVFPVIDVPLKDRIALIGVAKKIPNNVVLRVELLEETLLALSQESLGLGANPRGSCLSIVHRCFRSRGMPREPEIGVELDPSMQLNPCRSSLLFPGMRRGQLYLSRCSQPKRGRQQESTKSA